MEQTVKQRLTLFIKQKGLTGRSFARLMGLPETFVSSMRNSTSDENLHKIFVKFPDLNPTWLLTGEGEMLRKGPRNEVEDLTPAEQEQIDAAMTDRRVTYIPLVHIDSVGGIHSRNELTASGQYISGMVPFPDARRDDVAILQSGDSMAPTIPAGAILQIRKVEDWQEYFGYGNVYVLWLKDERRITKLIKRYDKDPEHYVLCCSYNPEAADEELPRSFIREVWKVVNVLINKGW